MPTIPLPGSAQADPSRMQRAVGFQSAEGVPSTSLVFGINNGGPLGFGPTYIGAENIRGTGERGELIGSDYQYQEGPLDHGPLDPASLWQHRFLASAAGGKYSLEQISGSHWRGRYGLTRPTALPAGGRLTLIDDVDLGLPARYTDVLPTGLTIQAATGQNLKLVTPIVVGPGDVFGAVTQTVGTGATLPQFRGIWHGNLANLVDGSVDSAIFCQVQDASAGTVKFKMGEASDYDGAEVTITAGDWYRLSGTFDLSDLFPDFYPVAFNDGPIGLRDNQIEIFASTLADWEDGDEFKVLPQRARSSPTYPTPRLLGVVQVRVRIAGREVRFGNGWTLTYDYDLKEGKGAPGGSQRYGTFRGGEQKVSLSVDREVVNLDMIVPLLARGRADIVIEGRTDVLIGGTQAFYGIDHVMPYCRYTGLLPGVAAGAKQRMNENYVFEAAPPPSAYSYRGMSFAGQAEFVVDTNLTSLT